jgi:hypothetical protein
MSKTVEEMTSTELKAHLAGTTPEPVKATKTKAPAKSKAKSKAKARKATTAKAPAKSKGKARKPAKAAKSNKSKRVPAVRLIAAFMVENKGKAFKSTDLAAKFKARPVEIHRAVSLLERQGAVVDAARSGPTQKPGRRAFLYTVTKAPVVKASKSKAGK